MLNITPEKEIECEIRLISVSRLRLDPNNVRLKHLGRDLADEELQDMIWNEPATRTLLREIEFSQGLSNPLVVDQRHIVREGNRRLVCLRKLAARIRDGESEIPLWKIEKVQCIVLPKETTEQQIALFLTLEHVTGKKEWRALNKAAQVHALSHTYGLHFEEIEKAVGRSAKAMCTMDAAYSTTLDYHRSYPDDANWLSKYSFFYELFRKPDLSKWAGTGSNLSRFMKWIATGKIKKGAEVRNLPLMVKDDLEESGFPVKSTEKSASDHELISAVRKTRVALRNLATESTRKIKKDDGTISAIRDLQTDLQNFLDSIPSQPQYELIDDG